MSTLNVQSTNHDTVNKGRAWFAKPCCQLFINSEVCYGDCWTLRRVAGEAHNMTENALSIFIIFSVQLQQTEISDRKLFIFQHGV